MFWCALWKGVAVLLQACLGQEGLLQSSSSALGHAEELGPILPQGCVLALSTPGCNLEPAGEAGRVWRMYKIHEQSSLGMYKYINYQQFYKRHTASHLSPTPVQTPQPPTLPPQLPHPFFLLFHHKT